MTLVARTLGSRWRGLLPGVLLALGAAAQLLACNDEAKDAGSDSSKTREADAGDDDARVDADDSTSDEASDDPAADDHEADEPATDEDAPSDPAPSDPSPSDPSPDDETDDDAAPATDGESPADEPADDETPVASDPTPTVIIDVDVPNPLTNPAEGPPAGNPDGNCAIPAEAALADASTPDRVVGDGTAASCTGDAFIEAVALGGVITFDCGPDPVTITVDRPAKVFNDASDDIVIDGGGLVTLSGGGTTRILYMNTCDEAQHFTTPHCNNQETPRLTVQNLTFVDGNSKNEEGNDGGGAIWAGGGRLKIINSRFFNNVCADVGPDVGGAGVRAFNQFDGLPVYLVNSTFGGAEGHGNSCSNGGGISSIGVNWVIINSLFTHNVATGNGGNPAQDNTPGGGSGGAIYNDGGTLTLSLCGTHIEHNQVNAFGSGIFFVSNNHDGTLIVKDSVVRNNSGGGWNVLPGISMHDDTRTEIENSTIE